MLKDKIIIVTGGSGLLGKHFISDIESKNGTAINFEVNVETDIDKHLVNCDITNTESVDNAIQIVLTKFKKIDGLVNNAYPRTKDWGAKFEDIPKASWDKNVHDQLNSYFYMCQQVSAIMTKQLFGSIVNIASIYGIVGPDFGVYQGTNMTMPAAYSVIKSGIINFTRYLASYYGKKNVRVNCVSPGGIFDNQNEIFVNNYNQKVPLGRLGNAEEIAPSVSFLISDQASYITGHNMVVDGGWSAI